MRVLRKIRKFRQLRRIRRARALPLVGEVMRLALRRHGHADLQPLDRRRSVRVLEELASPTCKSPSPLAASRAARSARLPGTQMQSDDELIDYARRSGGTCYHASCTCLMGSHAMAVVDDQLKVHGLDGLLVIDASVMPAVTSTNTNAPTIMIAEKGAALIKDAVQQRLAA
jgi:choline dehydrogenase-like flavoprotein